MNTNRNTSRANSLTSFWHLPVLFSILGAVLALGMIALDRGGLSQDFAELGGLISEEPSSATAMLRVLAGSMIGIAATMLAITIAAVAYASGKYGPRVLNSFVEDRGNQLSLATFLGCFIFALIILRRFSPGEAAVAASTAGLAPTLTLMTAYVLIAVSVAVLIYFLDHIPSAIRIGKVIDGIGNRLINAVRSTYPVEGVQAEITPSACSQVFRAGDTGYIEAIDFAELEEIARSNGTNIWLSVRTGDFVHRDLPLLRASLANTSADADALERSLRNCFSLGSNRTSEQDPQFLIDELVEIGLRSLSPGINDPMTAATAFHWLGAGTAELGLRDLRKDVCGEGVSGFPVIPRADDFGQFVERGFGAIRAAAATHPSSAAVMLEALENAAEAIPDSRRKSALRAEAEALLAQVQKTLSGPDLAAVEDRFRLLEQRVPATPVRAAS